MPIINGPASDPQTRLEIALYCKQFRHTELKISTNQLAKAVDRPKSTIESFESGKSSNLQHIVNYLVACTTKEVGDKFLEGVNNVIRNLAANK